MEILIDKDPLFNEGWVTFTEEKFNLKAKLLEFGPERGTAWEFKVLVYFNKHNKLVMPLRHPYLPANFATATDKLYSKNRRKRLAFTQFADFLKSHSLKDGLVLSPIIDDSRPFRWNNFVAETRYTYFLNNIGNDYLSNADKNINKRIKKAQSKGYFCSVTNDFSKVLDCLSFVEHRKNFSHVYNKNDLISLKNRMQDDILAFLVFDKNNIPVGTRIVICSQNGHALAWSAGIETNSLRDGVNFFLANEVIKKLVDRGCEKLDFVGANIPPVAEMKESFGGQLVPYFIIRQRNFHYILYDNYFNLKHLFNF